MCSHSAHVKQSTDATEIHSGPSASPRLAPLFSLHLRCCRPQRPVLGQHRYLTFSASAIALAPPHRPRFCCVTRKRVVTTSLLKTPNYAASKLGNNYTEHTAEIHTCSQRSHRTSTETTEIQSGPSPHLATLFSLHLPNCCSKGRAWSGPR